MRPSNPCAEAFSLIELLVAVAIVALLAAFAVPAFNSIGQARGVSEAAYQIASDVELARSEAVSRHTFVWLGMQAQTNSGNLDLRIGLVYSKDGTANTSATNLQAIGRAQLIQRVGLANAAGLSVGTNLGSPADLAAFTGGATFQVGQMNFNAGRTMTFTPQGEVATNATPSPTAGFDPRIAIGLQQVHGTTAAGNNDIAVVVDGSVGLPTIYQKK